MCFSLIGRTILDYWIVVVDDDPLCLTHARKILGEENMKVSCLNSGQALLKFMEKNAPDLVLMDVLMPGSDGFETFAALQDYEEKAGKEHIPVIFLTGEDDSATEQKGLKLGASDFIHKPLNKEILVKRIDNTLKNVKAISSLTEEAMFDKLTGFLNKTRGTERVSKLCTRITGALMIMDLDNFKLVNDLYGHDMGDKVLRAFADVVRNNTRETDTISRIGGDEFMAFYENLTDESAVASLTMRLNVQLVTEAAALMGEDNGIPLGISIGAVMIPNEGRDYEALFSKADKALYIVKKNGKHGYHIYSDESDEKGENSETADDRLDHILRTMEERTKKGGALFLGRDSFAIVYRFVMRFYRRYGGTPAFVLFTVVSDDKPGISKHLEYMQELEGILANTLRVSDIVMQSSSNTYFVMLTERSAVDAKAASDRIISSWEQSKSGKNAKLESTIRYMDDLKKEEYETE